MRSNVIYKARDLSLEERRAAEILLGHWLEEEEELVSVRSSKGTLSKVGLTGEARREAFQEFFDLSDRISKRADGIPDEEIDEAADFVRLDR